MFLGNQSTMSDSNLVAMSHALMPSRLLTMSQLFLTGTDDLEIKSKMCLHLCVERRKGSVMRSAHI